MNKYIHIRVACIFSVQGSYPFQKQISNTFLRFRLTFPGLLYTLIILLPRSQSQLTLFCNTQIPDQKPFSRTFQSLKMLLKMYPVSIPGVCKPLGDRVYQENTRGQVGYSIVHVYHKSITQLFYIIP